jgi:hypothetical protein
MVRLLEHKRFFAFDVFNHSDQRRRKDYILEGSQHWHDPLILSVLEHHLSGQGKAGDVARIVIYESLSNTRQHPNAQIVCMASHVSDIEGHPKKHLSITVWDDGKGIAETLRECLLDGYSVRQPLTQKNIADYALDNIGVTHRVSGSPNPKQDVRSSVHLWHDPTLTETDAWLLIYSMLPGITRKTGTFIDGIEPYIDPSGEVTTPNPDPGMGLYNLLETVVLSFHGSLAIRSGNYFLSIEEADRHDRKHYAAKYSATLTEKIGPLAEMIGNMITIRLPLEKI